MNLLVGIFNTKYEAQEAEVSGRLKVPCSVVGLIRCFVLHRADRFE